MGIALVIVSMGTALASPSDDRPRLEQFAPDAPAWAKDCTLDLVDVGDDMFSVAVTCRGSEELVFERRAMSTREFEARVDNEAERVGATPARVSIATARGPATGYASVFDGGAHVIVRRTPARGASDVYACTSIAERDQLARCKVLVEALGHSTVIRRGAAAFPRPKS